MDDQWALAHVAVSPGLELRGVVTTHAPNLASPAAQTSLDCAIDVLSYLPISYRPPVLAGSSAPLSDWQPRANPGVDFILAKSRDHSPADRLVILVLGAATDTASALLTDPTLGDRAEIVAMGFDAWPGGHDSFNVQNDVIAWQILLESQVPITVGNAAVSGRNLAMTRTGVQEVFAGCGSTGSYLAQLLLDWLDTYPELAKHVTGDSGTWPVWDEVTVAYLLKLTSSVIYPRPSLKNDLSFHHPVSLGATAGARMIHWITHVDSTGLWRHFARSLQRAQNAECECAV